MSVFNLINQTKDYLRDNAEGNWFQSYRIKEQNSDNFIHDLNGLEILIRVNYPEKMFGFFWFYNISDAHKLIKFTNKILRLESHEIIINPKIKIFYDIDLELTQEQLDSMIDWYSKYECDDINDLSRHLANLYFDATLASLDEHGNDLEYLQTNTDMMYSTRNRMIDSKWKLSIHIITNIVCTIDECKAIVEDVKKNILHFPDDNQLEYPDDYSSLIINAIDTQPYHRLGSLSITGGKKIVDGIEYTNELQQKFQLITEEPFITRIDYTDNKIKFNQYNAIPSYQINGNITISEKFIKEVYEYLYKIPYFNHNDWDLESASHKGCTAILRRIHPSYCSICERTHDLDNTLIIIFNEQRGTGAWKCIRAEELTSKVFYRYEGDDDDLEEFSKINRLSNYHTNDDNNKPLILEESYEDEIIEVQVEAQVEEEYLDSNISIELEEPYEEKPIEVKIIVKKDSDSYDDNSIELNIEEPYEDSSLESSSSDESESIESDDDSTELILEESYVEDPIQEKIIIKEVEDSESDGEQIELEIGYESDSDNKNTYKKDSTIDNNTIITDGGVVRYTQKNYIL
jgi:hypothetical protein